MPINPVTSQQVPNSLPTSAPSITGGATPAQVAQLNRMMSGGSATTSAASTGSGEVYRVNVGSGSPTTRTLNTPTGGSGVVNPRSAFYQPKPGGSGVIPKVSPVYDKYSPSSWNPSTPKPWERPTSAPAANSSPVPTPKTVSPAPWNSSGSAPYQNLPVNQPANFGTLGNQPVSVPNSLPTAAPSPTAALSPAYSPQRSGAGSSGFGSAAAGSAAAAAGMAIAQGENPVRAAAVAIAGYGGAQIGAAAGTAILPGFGTAAGAIIGGAAAAAAAAAGFDQLFPGLAPTNQGGSTAPPQARPITIPENGVVSDGLYRVCLSGITWYKSDRSDVRPFNSCSQYTGTNTPNAVNSLATKQPTYIDRDGWLKEAYTGVTVTEVQPGTGPQVMAPPSSQPGGSLQPISVPTDTTGQPVTPPKLQSAPQGQTQAPTLPKLGQAPQTIPFPSPSTSPSTSPSPLLSGAPPASSPPGLTGVPTPTPSGGSPGGFPTTSGSGTPSITSTGNYLPPSQQPPKTSVPSTQRDRSGNCCDPVPGSGGDCKFKPIEVVPVTVKTFLGCLPIAPYTPIYGAAVVSAVKGTEAQVERIFAQLADLAGAGCNPKAVQPSKVTVKVVKCGTPDKGNPPTGLVKQPVQLDGQGHPLPAPSHYEVEVEIPCVKGLEDEVRNHYEQLAEIRKAQCSIERDEYAYKVYQIMGGDDWYHRDGKGVTSKTPKRFEFFDSEFRLFAKQNFEVSGKEKEKLVELHSFPEWLKHCFGSLYYRTGIHEFPTQVSETMTTYSDEAQPIQIYSLSAYLAWFIRQFDLLVGQFPIQIEIEDTDPATKGNQTKRVELPNLSEALAELYGVGLTGSTNADLAINFLMRLSAEVMATKNASLITQDYAKANASFLGYRGNPQKREIDYAFNPAKLDSLEDFLQNTKAYITGWGEDDKENIVGYLQRLMFSAGIIKAAFMRNSKQMNQLTAEIKSLMENPQDEQAWKKFIEMINDPTSQFNQGVSDGTVPLSKLDNKPVADDAKQNSKPKSQQ